MENVVLHLSTVSTGLKYSKCWLLAQINNNTAKILDVVFSWFRGISLTILKFQSFILSSCKDIEIRTFEFVEKTQFFYAKTKWTVFWNYFVFILLISNYGRRIYQYNKDDFWFKFVSPPSMDTHVNMETKKTVNNLSLFVCLQICNL